MALGYVRPAEPADAGEIARIQLETWRIGYRRLLPARVVDQLDEQWLADNWRTAIVTPPSSRHQVMVAVEQAAQAQLVGFAASGPADQQAIAPQESAPPDPAVTAAVTDLLVSPRWGRRGHGSRLLAATVDRWHADGFVAALAWVFEGDQASWTFFTSAGWQPDGVRRALDVDDQLVPQTRLHTRLVD